PEGRIQRLRARPARTRPIRGKARTRPVLGRLPPGPDPLEERPAARRRAAVGAHGPQPGRPHRAGLGGAEPEARGRAGALGAALRALAPAGRAQGSRGPADRAPLARLQPGQPDPALASDPRPRGDPRPPERPAGPLPDQRAALPRADADAPRAGEGRGHAPDAPRA